ncbi:hypothetical protein AALP_AA1G345700 [Arabis alpina]|uniref:Bifunctional inhibitor/plant lipid transfer protein/seed storage helical domain-containing protein n=1 Tax=Arabis alpina TaxID=50452 RepID=A0A087HSK8_ARAAL|nr:hypothetical protein AALP_AA1G345700 [Arabis alpina]
MTQKLFRFGRRSDQRQWWYGTRRSSSISSTIKLKPTALTCSSSRTRFPYRSGLATLRLARKEFQESQHLRACQQWIRMRAMKPRYGLGVDDELDFEDDFENPQGPQQQHPLLQKCCSELHQEEPVCVCPTLKQAAKAVRLQGQHGPFQASKIYRTAKNLPNVCNIPQVDVCPFKAIPFFPPYY